MILLHYFLFFLSTVFSLRMATVSQVFDDICSFAFYHPEEYRKVRILNDVYSEFIQSAEEQDGDIVFIINGRKIYYCGGKMLSEANLERAEDFSSIFFDYKKGEINSLPSFRELPRRSSDFLDSMFGRSEREIRKHCRLISFLGHKAFLNDICVDAIKKVEKQILESARRDRDVEKYLKDIKIVYSFLKKEVVGSDNMSYHSYGLAVDIVPESYNGKHVYWKWSRVYNDRWYEIPLGRRWSPPQPVIDAFEKNGFIWGGKWYHFDTIHFEYRPEILFVNE